MKNYHGLSGERRKQLARILAPGKAIITIDFAAKILGVERETSKALLSSLSRSGWLKPIKPGIYAPVPLESDEPGLSQEHEFVVARYLYKNCYIGGWSAALFWGLTDQIFLKTWVMTDRPIRQKQVSKAGHNYILRHIPENYFFGAHSEWIKHDKVLISDPHKTIIDFANFITDFDLQGLVDTFTQYLRSEHKNLDILLDYATLTNNRAIFKRIGFLIELYEPLAAKHIARCLKNISKGPSDLAPSLKNKEYNKKWHLYVPKPMVKI